MTRLKRIEVVPSLKAEMSLVLHDTQAIANMQPEWEFHTPTNLEHHGGVSTCLRAGYFPLRHREKIEAFCLSIVTAHSIESGMSSDASVYDK